MTRLTQARPRKRPAHARAPQARNLHGDTLGDLRFRALLSEEAWERLPAPVRHRFAKRVAGGESAVYAGEIIETRMNVWGRALAQILRLIGAPLPVTMDCGVPAIVSVTEDVCGQGQVWSRLYGRKKGFPQVIHSAKRFAGPTGLEEYIGGGVGIALKLDATHDALHFLNDHYFIQIGGFRLRLPRFLCPGALTVSHVEQGNDAFDFVLKLVHPWFGTLIHQTARFHDLFEGGPSHV